MKINWYKIGFYLCAAFVVFLLLRSCGGPGGSYFSCNGKRDTISHKIDTTINRDSTDTVYVPTPVYIRDTIAGKPKPYAVHDTLETFEYEVKVEPVDTAAILKQYYQYAIYSDTQKIKRGTIIINDTVTQNRIARRGLKTFISDTTIKETVVLSQPKKMILYLGFSAIGSRKDPFHMAGADLSLKGKNDRQYSIGANIQNDGTLFYEAGIRFPIRLFKKK